MKINRLDRALIAFLIVALCFFLSGFAALLYQAAWLKKLAVIFGTSHVAVATVLAAYMGGLAFGALVASKLIHRIARPVLVYGILEGVIGISALLVPVFLEGAQSIFLFLYGGQAAPVSDGGFAQSAYYLGATFLVLVIPTGAMGATLPLLAKHAVTADEEIGPRIGALYGVNTVGAVCGALVAGFVLLPYLGLYETLAIGAAVNLAVFGAAVLLAKQFGSAASDGGQHPDNGSSGTTPFHWVMPVMLASGIVSFTLEVLWTRLLSHVFGGTVYAFSIMLACFLSGIAIGGMIAGRLASSSGRATILLACAQIAIAGVSLISYSLIDTAIPNEPGLWSRAVYSALIIIPSTLFIGATYPLAVRAGTQSALETSRTSGAIYAWNTLGAIVGALATGFFVLPEFGFAATLKFAMGLSLALAAVSFFFASGRGQVPATVATLVLLASMVLVLSPGRPDKLVYSQLGQSSEWGEEHYYGVGRSATILMRDRNGLFHLSSNGLSESAVTRKGSIPFNLSQKWLTGLPLLARPDATSMLVVGFGGGVALQGIPSSVQAVDVVELEEKVIEANLVIADKREHNPFVDDRINLVVNDARNALMLTDKTYDTIVSQPSHPWTGGASHLYTREFLALAKSKLAPSGVFLQWINSRFTDEALLKTLMATMLDQFGYVELYQAERDVLMFLASDAPIDLWDGQQNAVQALEANRTHFNSLGMMALEDAVMMMALDQEGVRNFSQGAPVNTDSHNLLAFFSKHDGSGLGADQLIELLKDIDPLSNPRSSFHRQMVGQFDTAYLADRLLSAQFPQRSYNLARATLAQDQKALIDALGFENTEDTAQAESLLHRALGHNPDNKQAQVALLRLYLDGFVQASLPRTISLLANKQDGPTRRVFEAWFMGSRGLFDRVQAMDSELALVPETSLVFSLAVKVRVDWRVAVASKNKDPGLAKEALDLLDTILAAHGARDLIVLRSGCAYLAGNGAEFVETASTLGIGLEGQLDELDKAGQVMHPGEAEMLLGVLNLIVERLKHPLTDTVAARANAVETKLKALIQRLQ